jgi:hypothetical protein
VPEAAYLVIQLTSLWALMAQATDLPSSLKRILVCWQGRVREEADWLGHKNPENALNS